MKTYEFTIVATGLDPDAEDFEDRFFDAGCGDATIAFQKGAIVVEFARESRSFLKAVTSAIDDVRRTGATVERIEPDYLVSLSDIARRVGITRSAVSLYANGERASGFPTPVARITSESPLWDWYQVARWMRSHSAALSVHDVLRARIVREMNLMVLQTGPPHRRKTLRPVPAMGNVQRNAAVDALKSLRRPGKGLTVEEILSARHEGHKY